MSWPKDIVLVGAGNVAWHLGRQLAHCGLCVSYVWSRSAEKATALANHLGCPGGNTLQDIPPRAALYLIAVKDDAIAAVAATLAQVIAPGALVLHTAGATPSTVLSPYFSHYGVFYPLQTFSRDREVDFKTIPLCLFTAQQADYPAVANLARLLSTKVYAVSDEQRAQLHLAAIFVNNFTNYLQHISRSLLREHNLPEELVQPLLMETILKLQDLTPREAQTGPAIREDQATIERHLAMLHDHPQWADIYTILTAGIKHDLG
ncbi:MAG: DUF2520 domain-containing protein [Bacteroidetes bacterium]|nr:MAG: DUF2520 domain-containing protein [Bacteroidota bacterium]PTM13634.1 MAG: DUF2520 domain-containing protein [Bacteroidota bacterium]